MKPIFMRFIIGGVLLVVGQHAMSAEGLPPDTKVHPVVPSLMGLDFTTVSFSPIILPLAPRIPELERGNRILTARAYTALQSAGLVPKPYKAREAGEEPGLDPKLTLTLSTFEVEGCPEKVLYTAKLELYEKSLIQREPYRWNWSPSWTSVISNARVVDSTEINMDRLQHDLDTLLGFFIEDYKRWNRGKESEEK